MQDSIREALLQQQQQMQLVSEVTRKIRQSRQLQEILDTIVVGAQGILQTDRVLIYQVLPDRTGKTISEAVLPGYPALGAQPFPEEVFPKHAQQLYRQGRVRAIADVHDSAFGLSACLVEFVAQFGIRAKLVVPIVQTLPARPQGNALAQTHLWGLLIAHQCRSVRHWVNFELELLQQLADQIGIALLQAQLLQHWSADGATCPPDTRCLQDGDETVQASLALTCTIGDRKATEQRKDELISIISHELRTSLTALQSALKILATGRLGTLSSAGQHMLSIADESTERLVRLGNQVLDLQRLESGQVVMERQPCNAADLILQATEAMQAMAQQYGVTLIPQAEEMTIWADADHILQTLTNLLSNAIKFSASGGRIWISATCTEKLRPPHNTIASSRVVYNPKPLAEAVFCIRDQGQGIPADQLEKIFDWFQQVDSSDSRKKGGTGLGLAICRKIVEQHNGRIWAESTPGCGSTFTFTIPLLAKAYLPEETD